MAVIASGILCAWPGTVASIPAHWTRQAALDGRYPRGAAAGVAPGGTGGSATHSHAEPGHSHTLPNHAHGGAGSSGSASASVGVTNSGSTAPNLGAVPAGHTHSIDTSPSVGGSVTDSPGWQAAASDPPVTVTVVWLQSDGTPTGFPANALCFWYQAKPPTGWTQYAQSVGGTPVGFYLVGAATGVGGGTQGGTTLSGHSHGGTGHTHTISGHSHGGTSAASVSSTVAAYTATGVNVAGTHAHGATYNATDIISGSTVGPACALTVAEPPYNTLLVLQNTSGANALPAYSIALWLGALSALPTGWSLCDGTGGTPDLRTLFAKAAVNPGDIGSTGGAQGHTHTAPAATHQHSAAHTHSITISTDIETGTAADPGSVGMASPGHGHSAPASTGFSDLLSAVIQELTAAADSRPPYTDVAFLMYTAAPTLTITSPAAGASEALPSFALAWVWDVLRLQVTAQVTVLAADQVTVVYDSGPLLTTSQTFTIPAGYLQNGQTYYLRVFATDSGHQSATSPLVNITTSWTNPPTPGGLAVTTIGGV